jgi:hypothetical protein
MRSKLFRQTTNLMLRRRKNKLSARYLNVVRERGASLISFSSHTNHTPDQSDTARKMKKLLLNESRYDRQDIFFRSLSVLSQLPHEMLKLPTSPLKVALHFVDASVMTCPGPNMDDGRGSTMLHWLA